VWQKCLAVLASGADQLKQGNGAAAERAFAAALLMARPLPPEQVRDISSLALCNLSLLRSRQGRGEEAQQLREQATAGLADGRDCAQDALFHHLMVGALMDLGEFRRAIPFCEQSIQLEKEWNEPDAIAEMLWRAGTCYNRVGLRDHAAVTLREALKLFRKQTGDPRLPAVLLNLGNALRKSSPAEAEAHYQEAADWYVAKAQLESATPAWVNLGVLCSEQGRHAEALAHYEKTLRVRERSPHTPPERMGTSLNNMANCQRRMRKFDDALHFVDRALATLKPIGGTSLASTYGTRGLIFRDDGHDAEAVEWLAKACAEHEKQPSPSLDMLADDMENLVAALKRVGRLHEATAAEERLASVRAAMKAIPEVERDLSNMKVTTEGAILIELSFGSHPGNVFGKTDIVHLGRRLSEEVAMQAAGWYGGDVVIPESTTLLLYGADGERLFQAVEPILLSEAMCQRARVTIRQGGAHRELFLPGPVM